LEEKRPLAFLNLTGVNRLLLFFGMSVKYHVDQTFNAKSIATEALEVGSYEDCRFNGLDLSAASLRGFQFIDCQFTDCNLSNATITKCSWQEVYFTDCKLLGLAWNSVNPFNLALHFQNSQLDHGNFFQLNLRRSSFKNCRLLSCDFSEVDLRTRPLTDCDLAGAIFDRSNLKEADLSHSIHLNLDPEFNTITGLKISQSALNGLLNKYKLRIEN
jgi:fluoroquinolone resistance protein